MNSLPYHVKISIPSLQTMAQLAKTLAAQLQPGDVLSLDGPLGAGKTTFTQKLGQALGVQELIASPTFVLIHEYQTGQIPLAHVDLYRLGPEKAHTLADELFAIADDGQAILLVEWATYGDFMVELSNITIDLQYDLSHSEARTMLIKSQRPLRLESFLS